MSRLLLAHLVPRLKARKVGLGAEQYLAVQLSALPSVDG